MRTITGLITIILICFILGCGAKQDASRETSPDADQNILIDPISNKDAAIAALVGIWELHDKWEHEGVLREYHEKIIRREDGTFTALAREFNHTAKTYNDSEINGSWQILGSKYTNTLEGTRVPWDYKILKLTNSEFEYIFIDSEGNLDEDLISTEKKVYDMDLKPLPDEYTNSE